MPTEGEGVIVAPEAVARAERALTQVIVSLKSWATRDRITIRGIEAQDLVRRAESARQEIVALVGTRPRRAVPPTIRRAVIERGGQRCARCGCDLSHAAAHIDHIVPLARYGTDDIDNLQALCAPCNLAKGARS